MESTVKPQKARIFNYYTFGFIAKVERTRGNLDVLIRKVLYRGTKKLPDGKKIPELQDRLPGGCSLVIDIVNGVEKFLQEENDTILLSALKKLQMIHMDYEMKSQSSNEKINIHPFLLESENVIFKCLNVKEDVIFPEQLREKARKIFEFSKFETLRREIHDETGLEYERAISTPVEMVYDDKHRKFSFFVGNVSGPAVFTGSPDSDIERSEWVSFQIFRNNIWHGHRLFLDGFLRELNKKYLAEGKLALAKLVDAPIHS